MSVLDEILDAMAQIAMKNEQGGNGLTVPLQIKLTFEELVDLKADNKAKPHLRYTEDGKTLLFDGIPITVMEIEQGGSHD